MLAQFPEDMQSFTGVPNNPELITMPFNQPRTVQLVWLAKTLPWMFVHALAIAMRSYGLPVPTRLYTADPKKRTTIEKICSADMIVSIGAERINDNFYKSILFSLYQLWTIQLQRKFLVLFPQTIGPFHFRLTRRLARKIIDACDVVFLRDRKSREIMQDLKIEHPIVIDTCDVAVLQSPAHQDEACAILNSSGVPEDGTPLIGISAMRWSYVKAQGKSTYNDYRDAIAQVADDLIVEKGARIVFLATNVPVHGCREDDVAVSRDIVACMQHSARTHIIERLCTPAQMKAIMGLMEMCLVTRMHACILSTGMLTPTCSINYQFKLHEYMKLAGLGDYTIDIDQVSYARLKPLVCKAWDDRPMMRTTLNHSMRAMIERLRTEMANLNRYFPRQAPHGTHNRAANSTCKN